MSRLLMANLRKLKGDVVFWICMLVVLSLDLFTILNFYRQCSEDNITGSPDGLLFGCAVMIGIAGAVFVSLHIGTEYSEGTIRNKLIVGHTRTQIYLAQFFACLMGAVAMILAYVILSAALGRMLLGAFEFSLGEILWMLLSTILLTAALIGIYTMLGMLIQNKAIGAVVMILGIFLMFFGSTYLNSRLSEPETWSDYVEIDESGNLIQGEEEPNPYYVSGQKRAIYETVLDVLPTGQAIKLANLQADHLGRRTVYSCLIALFTTGVGLYGFSKKDIR